MDKRSLLQKRDIPVLLVILLAAVLGIFLLRQSRAAEIIVIEQNGKELHRYILAELTNTQLVHVDGKNGISAEIEVGSGGARFVKANCPDQQCVHTGLVSKGNESAICLPGRISIRAAGGDAADAVTY